MTYRIEFIVSEFLDRHWDKQRPLLLGFSGGPDSLALLHLLLCYRERQPLFSFALAHVDHGWRLESKEEVRQITLMADKLQIPLHVTSLRPEEMSGNLEALCREERLKFFADLSRTFHYQAVLLGHHADDFAETVLKRVLEGCSLSNLSGLRPFAEVFGVKLWRPLLSVSKESLAQWLGMRSLKGFDDHTNRDSKFLRARFRSNILPQLSREFGKQVHPGLCRIGEDAAELRDYMDKKISPYLAKVRNNKIGCFLDLSREYPDSLFEMKYLIRRFCENEDLSISKESVVLAATLLLEREANKQVSIGNQQLHVDRGCLFFLRTDKFLPLPTERMRLQEGKMRFGNWIIQVNCYRQEVNGNSSDWRSLWQESIEVILPEGEYELGVPKLTAPYPRTSSLAKWWTHHKIPAFLRLQLPVIYFQNEIIHEFLTGKKIPISVNCENFLRIKLSLLK